MTGKGSWSGSPVGSTGCAAMPGRPCRSPYGVISVFGRHFVGSETCVEIGHLFVRRDLGLSGRYVLLDDGCFSGDVLQIRVHADAEEQVECNQSRFWRRRYPYTVAENDSKAVHSTLPVFCHPWRVASLVRSIRPSALGWHRGRYISQVRCCRFRANFFLRYGSLISDHDGDGEILSGGPGMLLAFADFRLDIRAPSSATAARP